MTAQPANDSVVDHEPRFLAHGLPADGELTYDLLRALPEDPFWKYELLDGTLLVSSDFYAITVEDRENFPVPPNWRIELLDGMLIVTPAPGFRHQSCAGSLYILLRQACPRGLATIIAPFDYQPIPTLAIQPDVLIARRPVAEKRLTEAPVLAVEVLSPKTRRLDLHSKTATYADYGDEHYWFVDPAGPSIEAFRSAGDGYELVAKADAGQAFEVSEPVALSFDPLVLLDE